MNIEQIQNFLTQISTIKKKYEEIAERTGENFNIFKVLKVTANEVRTHSAFVAELLNPKGSHGQKAIFLKLFVEQLSLKEFDSESATVKVEKYIGLISNDGKEGGFIDIIITDKNKKAIIIENKLYAVDQRNQLLRYYNYGVKEYKDRFKLLYLTLDGKEPSDLSKATLNKYDYTNISYAEFVIKWLDNCKEKAVNHPLLRESITQYVNLLKFLTGKAINNDMEIDLKKILISQPEIVNIIPELAEIACTLKNETIAQIKDETLAQIKDKTIAQMNDKLKKKNGHPQFQDFEVYVDVVSDEEGFTYCFGAKNNGEHISPVDFKEPLLSLSKYMEGKGFKTIGSYIGWRNFDKESDQLESLPFTRLIELNESGSIQKMAEEINQSM
jgi:hypothetical protein